MRRHIAIAICLILLIVIFRVYTHKLPKALRSQFNAMKEAESLEFLTIHPLGGPDEFTTAGSDATEPQIEEESLGAVGGHGILARTDLTADRARPLLDGLEAMARAGDKHAAQCFNPGYALRDPAHPEQYLLICFECSRLVFTPKHGRNMVHIDTSAAPETLRAFEDLVKEFGMRMYNDPQ